MKKILLCLVLLFPLFVNADVDYSKLPHENNWYEESSYVIDSYDINIIVNKDNSYDVTETINVYFYEERHGIVREIPYDKSIENIKVNEQFTNYSTSSPTNLQIGSSNITIIGEKEYIISYHLENYDDQTDLYDKFAFNLIGNEWDTGIGNVTFTITMPQNFSKENIEFSSNDVAYNVIDNVISGNLNVWLSAYEGLSISILLDDGYFSTTNC